MTNKKATAPTVAHGSIAAPILPVPDAAATLAARFLALLGKDSATTRLRTFLGKGAKSGWDLKKAEKWNQNGGGVYFVTGNGGDSDAEITSCPALFVEWDDGASIEEQMQRWQVLNLPEPTVMVSTGGKSVHCYWVLDQPMAPAEWQPLQKRLIDYCGGDKACSNPSRVMRLPGFIYEKNPAAKARCRILENASGNRCTAGDIDCALPVEVAPKPVARALEVLPGGLSGDMPPRGIEAINEAAGFIPRRVGDQGTYPSDRNALCGCSAALHEAGHPDPDGAALALLGHLWPDESKAAQVLRSSTTREAKSFWAIAKEHGYNLTRHDHKSHRLKPQRSSDQGPAQLQQADPAPANPEPQAPTQQRRPLTMAEVGDRLREASREGIGGADLAALVAEMAAASEQSSINVHRMADAICAEQLQAVAVAAEAKQIAAERDRQEIGELLSARYLLPDSIAAAIEARSRYLPCAGPSAVLPFLATVAGLVKLGTEVEGCAVAGYRVPVNLFACLVGRSGAKKSPISRLLVEAPTAGLRADLAHANQREREAWEQECRETKKSVTRPPAPNPKRLSVSDFTGEALAAQLQTQEAAGLGLLVNRDELSGLFGSLNAYRGGRGADEQQLLELFDGSGLSSLRIVGDRHYSRSQLSIWGSTQTDVLRQLVADGDASGLWARFLFVPLPERAVPLPLATSAAEVAEVEAAAATLANACGAVYRLPRQTYRLAPAAAERFAHYELNRQRAALGTTIGAQSALYGKSAGKVLRVAGVLHLLQIAAGEISSGTAIEPGTIEQATALVDHLDAWALGLHAEVDAGGVGQLMRTVHRVAEAVAGPIRWKELAGRLSAKARKKTDAAAFAETARALAAAGYGEVETGDRGAISYRATHALP